MKTGKSSNSMTGSIIAIDADGVLLDYNTAYRSAWEKAFGESPILTDVNAYWAFDRWGVRWLDGMELSKFQAVFDEEFWSTIPALPNAVKACEDLHAAGYQLVCVSAIESCFESARIQNIQDQGFPIERVICTAKDANNKSPKADALNLLRPVAFVDDFLPYFRGIPNDIHAALVLREPNGSPNVGEELSIIHSQHNDLASFASWWLEKHC